MSAKLVNLDGGLSKLAKTVVIVAFVISVIDVFIGLFFVWQGTMDIEYASISMWAGVLFLVGLAMASVFAFIFQKVKTAGWFVAMLIPTVALVLVTFLVLADFISVLSLAGA